MKVELQMKHSLRHIPSGIWVLGFVSLLMDISSEMIHSLLAVFGSLGALTKPLFAVASSIDLVLTARLLDRVGKGVRGAPRDAMVARKNEGQVLQSNVSRRVMFQQSLSIRL